MSEQNFRPYTLSDIWHAARTERNFNYAFWLHILLDICLETAVRNGGYCLVIFACALIITISIFGFFIVIPAVAKPWSLWFIFNDFWGLFMLFSISFNYYMAVTTKPGKPIDEMKSIYRDMLPSEHEKMCKKCNFVKPGRTHHCSVCKSCVMKMDHHCPWLSNCVGYKNYRYFVSFLVWVTVTTSYVCLICSPEVLKGGSVLFPDENFSLKTAMYNAIMKPQFPDVNIFGSFKEFVDGESKVLDLESQERKQIFAGGMVQDNAPPAPLEERRLEDVGVEYHTNIAPTVTYWQKLVGALPMERQLTTTHKHHSHHTNAEQHTRLKNTSLYYKLSHWKEVLPETDFLLFFTFVLSLGVTCGTGILMWFHLFLISRGQSTLEYFEGQMISNRLSREGRKYVNPYDRGLLKNFQQVFGEVPWYMMLLPSRREPPPYYLCLGRQAYPCGHTQP